MKTKYLFALCRDTITRSTLFVDVYVGDGEQERRDLNYFINLAESSNVYFLKRYDNETADFLLAVTDALRSELDDPRVSCLRCSMSAAKLRRLLKSGLYDEWSRIYFECTFALRRLNYSPNSGYFLAVGRADQILCNPHT